MVQRLMYRLMAKLFIKGSENTQDPAIRRKYGVMSGIFGIICNILLFTSKFIAGAITSSISITADAFNNLSDAGSSLVTLIGFKMSGKPADHSHPFGHGRIEYISGLVVSLAILIMGLELGLSSIEKIITPAPVEFSVVSAVILCASIALKLVMFFFNRGVAGAIGSTTMNATAKDSLSDACATTVVLAGLLSAHFFSLQIDGWLGALVAVFIFCTGISTARDTLNELLGQPPDTEFVRAIRDAVMEYPEILGIHDLIVHDYGPGRCMMSLHAEVSSTDDLMQIHDVIDIIETKLMKTFDCTAIIHMDPVVVDDETTNTMHSKIAQLVKLIDPSITIHDFRMTQGPIHSNLIFDVVVPYKFRLSDKELAEAVSLGVKTLDERYNAVICVDKSYT